MSFAFPNAPELEDPLLSHRFGVFFLGGLGVAHPLDFRFSHVSGLGMHNFSRTEENPGGTLEFPNLILERGMPSISTLRAEVMNALSSVAQVRRDVLVSILDENALPLSSWLLTETIPVSWSLSPLDAQSPDVIIERIELEYRNIRPFSL